jgi:hypothetical protein
MGGYCRGFPGIDGRILLIWILEIWAANVLNGFSFIGIFGEY